ncbi:MAG: anthranilate phosphoribosyltransferase [Candidatus Zixiibacteriota bacterium]
MISSAIKKLVESNNLSFDESKIVMEEIMTGQASSVQKSAYLTALRMKGETSDEILGSAMVMREKVCRIKHHQKKLFDNCGTGGDGSGTFNISTTASFVIAGCGVPVGKHGNRSVSSQCGSADLLSELGANIDLSPEKVGECIDEVGIGFLFAPNLHPAMKEVVPVRKELGIRTIFNILGPLTNPAFATHQMIGIFDGNYTNRLAEVAMRLGIKSNLIVHNEIGIDEFATTGMNFVSYSNNGLIHDGKINPEKFGFTPCKIEDLKGGNAKDNASITREILNGRKSPKRDTVILNAGVALMVAEEVENIEEGIAKATEAIDSGAAVEILNLFIEFTKRN